MTVEMNGIGANGEQVVEEPQPMAASNFISPSQTATTEITGVAVGCIIDTDAEVHQMYFMTSLNQ
ncbi:hypothetical protein HOLleu_28790 [Holothuria leucospilota]|uniref:Uncharacterized protein n=1 Tax=Holothuria leucospilota TaxID=206669 RepID=A0A9Q1BMP3_HOLLE|nr:hypothetical protein HOLleu_28790 [Holothuria leucospilota]